MGQVVENLLCKQEGLSLIPRNSPGAVICTLNPSSGDRSIHEACWPNWLQIGNSRFEPLSRTWWRVSERHPMWNGSLQVKSKYTQPRNKPNKGYERPLQWRCLRKNERQQRNWWKYKIERKDWTSRVNSKLNIVKMILNYLIHGFNTVLSQFSNILYRHRKNPKVHVEEHIQKELK